MKKRNLIIFIVLFVVSALCIALGAMLKVLYPEQTFSWLMTLGIIGTTTAVILLLVGILHKTKV